MGGWGRRDEGIRRHQGKGAFVIATITALQCHEMVFDIATRAHDLPAVLAKNARGLVQSVNIGFGLDTLIYDRQFEICASIEPCD